MPRGGPWAWECSGRLTGSRSLQDWSGEWIWLSPLAPSQRWGTPGQPAVADRTWAIGADGCGPRARVLCLYMIWTFLSAYQALTRLPGPSGDDLKIPHRVLMKEGQGSL